MTIALILLSGILTVLLGRWMFGKWFNHVGLYGVVWSFSLCMFHVGLIRYYPLESETWLVIAGGWIAFVFGSGVAICARFAVHNKTQEVLNEPSNISGIEHTHLLRILWVINI
ncbi:MAG: hypothetical protein AAB393_10195, partial [Bacteroidota bacterium]